MTVLSCGFHDGFKQDPHHEMWPLQVIHVHIRSICRSPGIDRMSFTPLTYQWKSHPSWFQALWMSY